MKHFLLGLALLVPAALAAGAKLGLVINGKPYSSQAVVVNGKTYVPLEALKAAGVRAAQAGGTLSLTLPGAAPAAQKVTAGGAEQRAALEGCIGETLFNGVWRFTVKSVEPISRSETVPGWGVTVELRNGTKTNAQLAYTGLKSLDLVMPDGNTLEIDGYDAQQVEFRDLPQAAGVTHQLRFFFPLNTPAENLPRPAKLLVSLDGKGITAGKLIAAGAAYTVPDPSFRVRLDCQR